MARLMAGRARLATGAMLVAAASLGGVVLGIANQVGASTHSTLSSSTGACAANMQTCTSRDSGPGGQITVSSDEVTVKASGRGVVAVGTYRSDPAGVFAASVDRFFGISLSSGSGFTSVAIKDCNLAGGASLYWWKGDAWAPLLSQGGTTYSSTCISVTIGATSTPKLSTVVKLSRRSRLGVAVFAVGGYPSST